jgi:hypothetical protein
MATDRLSQNQSCCIPKAKHPSRCDPKERRPRTKMARPHQFWFCRKRTAPHGSVSESSSSFRFTSHWASFVRRKIGT